MDNTGAILGPLVAAAVIALFFNNSHNIESYRFLFTIALVPAILGVIVLLFLQEKHLVKEPVTINILKLSQNNKAMRFTALMAFLALGQFSIMMVLIWAGNYLELIYIPILYLAYNASYATFSLTASKIVRFIEAKRVILLGMLVFAASMILLSFSYSGVSLLLSVLLIGLAMAIFETVAPAYLMKKTEEGSYATTMGFYRAVVGIVALPGNLIAGLLWGTMLFGLHAPFLFSAAVAIAAFMLATLTINGSGKH
jgi:MFS family permease